LFLDRRHFFGGSPAWAYARGLDLVAWGKMRYNLLGQGDHWFPGENAARLDPAALASSLRQCPFSREIPKILGETQAWLFECHQKRLSQS
jgi:hypothetical protein